MINNYIFDVWIDNSGFGGVKDRVLRTIRIPETKTLYFFAKIITRAFEFNFDHCFGFFNNLNNCYKSTRCYELFSDIGEGSGTPSSKSVKRTAVGEAFEKPGDKMLFLFDYGDEWRFIVELKEMADLEKKNSKSAVLKCAGKAPDQYPEEE
ncbi:MAG: hypothetical protein AABZ57_05105 [Candidatus Margulisiibacteriota bacterium]